MIQQVRIKEVFTANGIPNLTRTVFGFGTHPDAAESEQHPVTAALADGNRMRVIFDELLRGNNLEEIQCRAAIEVNDAFGPVPVGDTPDDLARCAVAKDVLPVRCPGSDPRSVCICNIDGGCPAEDLSFTTPRGESVGIRDVDSDGAPDATRFMQGAVIVRCGPDDVQANLEMSYWTPSGTQQKPVQGGFDSLGPAVVLVPGAALPTGVDCTLVFAPSVVDKDGVQVCAPAAGDITAGCTPGDTSAVHFTVEPLGFLVSPAVTDPGQSRTEPIRVRARAPIDPASVAGVTVTEGDATVYTRFTATVGTGVDANLITITWTEGGLAAATRYTINLPTTVTDAYHHGAPQPFQVAFTTAN